ncbi:MATE family efflux transporter [Sulfurimonas sp. HSL-3221]|uniref:MATE family efflux transporter n=1 Tax=Sulfurimonadaceae TaxID=2771471 RepID=UPI001E35509F|nr:MATE family efflux transporter [Sulfurimonas sp. HSL-3221]UFS61854.1 MATE family efflux transporter [Sulfurimonas sp. HSL-3221]
MQLDLTRGSIRSHIRTLAVPACIGFFFHTLFNITDTYFAGTISTQALAALSLSFPIFFIIISLAEGMSEAVTALVGNALGAGETAQAHHLARNALLFGGLLAIALTAAGFAAAPALMVSLGARDAYLAEALAYINVIIAGTGLFVFTFFLNALLNAVGDTVSFRNVLIVAAVINVALDAWFVRGGFGVAPMGVTGIALATVIIESMSAAYLYYRLKTKPVYRGSAPFRFDPAALGELIRQGIPPSANLALMAAGIYIITYFAAPYGQEVVAAYGVGMRIEQIILMPAVGLNVAVLAIVAQNSGARRFERIGETVGRSLFYGAVVALIGGIVLFAGAGTVMGVFSDIPDVIDEGVLYLRVEAFLIYPFVVIFTYVAMLQGVKRPAFIFYISLARQVVAPLIVLWVLARIAPAALSVWLGVGGVVITAAVVTYWYARRILTDLSRVPL